MKENASYFYALNHIYTVLNLYIYYQMNAKTRECYIQIAKIAEKAERYGDMFHAIKHVLANNTDSTLEERQLLAKASKNMSQSWIAALKTLSSIQEEEDQKNIGLLRGFKTKIENELNLFINQILNLIENNLKVETLSAEPKVFYLKMKGDCHRWIFEYVSGTDKKKILDIAYQAYKIGHEEAEKNLEAFNPIKLQLTLKYAFFLYQIIKDPRKASQIVNQAFDHALADFDKIEQPKLYSDASKWMYVLRKSYVLWTSELEESGK